MLLLSSANVALLSFVCWLRIQADISKHDLGHKVKMIEEWLRKGSGLQLTISGSSSDPSDQGGLVVCPFRLS